jgi:hypothetical protein
MPATSELFRFVTLRPANRVLMHRIESRLIRDRRASSSVRGTLFGPGEFESKLAAAEALALAPDFLDEADPAMRAMDPVVDFFRGGLTPGHPIAELAEDFRASFPQLALLLRLAPPEDLLEATNRLVGVVWDCLYVQVTLGCDRFVSTNHLVDALRVYHVLALLWLSGKLEIEAWGGGGFDEYHPLIDLEAANDDDTSAAAGTARAAATLAGALGSFRVPLSVGDMKPPTVGDLIVVEQELRSYEQTELAEVETVMRGERREHSVRTLSRTTQTTTTETSSEQEETSSLNTDERFRVSSEAQTIAAQSFGVDVGVSVSGKFGPVQVAATANASYDTSKSTTDTTSQEYAKTVTEEATRRVSNSIKESSSITILSETQDTSLRGFNNEGGTAHVNGMYRWLGKVYDAKLLNYGRRVMLSLNPPEPAKYYRARLEQTEAQAMADLVEPLHPSRLNASNLNPLDEGESGGIESYQDIELDNYAQLAAIYDVTSVQPPIPKTLTGSKAIAVPEAMPPDEMNDEGLSVVTADSTLTIDPDYRITRFGVYAPEGGGKFRHWASALHLGEKKNDTDTIVVMLGDHDFHFNATGEGDNNPKTIDSNFNTMVPLKDEFETFGSELRPSLPITISASFSGMLTLHVIYEATRRDEALDRWKASTYAAILKGYIAKRQAYDQALALAQAQVKSDTVAQTFQLREDQYRAIELTELKRSCIDLMTEGTAHGHTSISVADDGTPTIVYDDPAGAGNWRSPLANGTVAEFFETALDWQQTTYTFHPYYWAAAKRWTETAGAAGADPIFESFLRAGSASVVVPVRPGFERPMSLFLKTGLIWGGRYLPLFSTPEMLDVYADVELGTQLDPPEQLGATWQIRVPTSLVMLQEDDTLPEFPPPTLEEPPAPLPEPRLGEPAPF